MSAQPPEADTAPEAIEAPGGRRASADRRKPRWPAALGLGVLAFVALLLALAAGARLMVRTGAGRSAVLQLLEGLPLGPVGRLHVEGLAGDPLSDLTLARLQIVDARGPWLDAEDVEMRWRFGELLSRRFHAQAITARRLTLLRDPLLAPQPPSKGASELPLAVQVDRLALRLETRPAFSVRQGLYDVAGGFTLERNMAAQGRLSVQSRLHAGDGLQAAFQVGQGGRVQVRAQAAEGPGGALAGALGLPVDRALSVQVRADGTVQTGALSLSARTGPDTPLTAEATWGAGAAQLQAQLTLGASRFTRDLASRAGPQARLTLAARHLHGDVFDVHGQLAAQTASLKIDGPLDWKVRTTTGLALALQVSDARRWAPSVDIASAQLAGGLVGDPDRFDFKGRIAAQNLAQSGYSLASAQGPVALSLRQKVWALQADLRGAGGAGRGLTPGLFGATPHVVLDGTRLADGRLLIRNLDAQGTGLTLSGQGGQGLFGGLSFKGAATVASVASLQKGARGRLQLAWSAEQPKGAPDWRFTTDAHAQGFSLGVAPVDHFLGAAPHLTAAAAWGPGGLHVASAALDGAAVQVSGSGVLDPRGAMAFGLDWRAQGPFEAGPLKVAGVADGTAKLGGSLSAPTLQLDSQLASLALGRLIVTPAHLELGLLKDGDALGGQIFLTGPSAYGPASLKAGFRFAGAGVEVHDLVADAGGVKAAGSLSLQNGAPSTADLDVQARAGALLAAGQVSGTVKLTGGAAGLRARLALDGSDVAAPGLPGVVRKLHLRAEGPLDHLPLQIAAQGAAPEPWRLDASGRLDRQGAAQTLTLNGAGQLRTVGFKTLRPATLRLDGGARQLDVALGVGGGRVDLSARQTGDALSGDARLSALSLAALDPDYAGTINGALALDGHGDRLGGTLDIALAGARSRDAPADLALDGRVRANLAGDRLRLDAAATNGQGLKSALHLELAAVASAAPFRIAIDRTRPMRGDFSADGELRPLWDLLVGGDQRLSGHVAAQGALAGTLDAPKLTGHAAIAKGRYQNFAVGLDLQDFTAAADFDRDALRIGQLTGSDGHGGTLSGSGDVATAPNGASSFALRLTHFRVIDTETVMATMSGAATVSRDARGRAKLVGALKVDRADISPSAPAPSGVAPMDVVEINKPGEATPVAGAAKPAQTAPPILALDVSVHSARGVFVKGKGLNVELSLDAHIGGSASAPVLSGEARGGAGLLRLRRQALRFRERERGAARDRAAEHPPEPDRQTPERHPDRRGARHRNRRQARHQAHLRTRAASGRGAVGGAVRLLRRPADRRPGRGAGLHPRLAERRGRLRRAGPAPPVRRPGPARLRPGSLGHGRLGRQVRQRQRLCGADRRGPRRTLGGRGAEGAQELLDHLARGRAGRRPALHPVRHDLQIAAGPRAQINPAKGEDGSA